MAAVYPDPTSEFTAARPTTAGGRFLQFPMTRFVILLLFMIVPGVIQVLLKYFRDSSIPEGGRGIAAVVFELVMIVLLFLTYQKYCLWIEKRPAVELSTKKFLPEFVNGLGLGAGLVGLSTAVVILLSDTTIVRGSAGWPILITQFTFFSMAALWEEIVFRLILFRLTEEWLGSWPAILIQAVLFGFMHGGNPGATVWSSISIVLSAGALLAALYMLTRRIWMVWGVHIFWNYFQSAIMGLPVSGGEADGILSTKLDGPTWITGGAFGIEASALPVLIVLVTGIVFFRIVILNKRIVPSLRKRRAMLAALIAEQQPAG